MPATLAHRLQHLPRLKGYAVQAERLLGDGYVPGAHCRRCDALNRHAAAASQCPACGQRGLDLASFVKPGSAPPQMRVFAHCIECGWAQEVQEVKVS